MCFSGFLTEKEDSKKSWEALSKYFDPQGLTVYDCKWESHTHLEVNKIVAGVGALWTAADVALAVA